MFSVRLFSPTVDCGVYPHLHQVTVDHVIHVHLLLNDLNLVQVSQQKPSELQEINSITCHESVVLTTRYYSISLLMCTVYALQNTSTKLNVSLMFPWSCSQQGVFVSTQPVRHDGLSERQGHT